MILFLLQSSVSVLENTFENTRACVQFIKSEETLRALLAHGKGQTICGYKPEQILTRNQLKILGLLKDDAPAFQFQYHAHAAMLKKQKDEAAQRDREALAAQRQREAAQRDREALAAQRRREAAVAPDYFAEILRRQREAEALEQRRRVAAVEERRQREVVIPLKDQFENLMRDYRPGVGEPVIPQDQWDGIIKTALEYSQNLQDLELTPEQLLQFALHNYRVHIKRAAELEEIRLAKADKELAIQRGDTNLKKGRLFGLDKVLIPPEKLDLYLSKHDFTKKEEMLKLATLLTIIIPDIRLTKTYEEYKNLYQTWIDEYVAQERRAECIKWGFSALDKAIMIQPEKYIAATHLFMFAMAYIEKNNLEGGLGENILLSLGECSSTFLEILLKISLAHYGFDQIKIEETLEMAKDRFLELFWNSIPIKSLHYNMKNIDELWIVLADHAPELLLDRNKDKETEETIEALVQKYYNMQFDKLKQNPYYKKTKFKIALEVYSWDEVIDLLDFKVMAQKPDQTEATIDKEYVNSLNLKMGDRGYAAPMTTQDLTALRNSKDVYQAAANHSQKIWKRFQYLQNKKRFNKKGIEDCKVIIEKWVNESPDKAGLIDYIKSRDFQGVWREALKDENLRGFAEAHLYHPQAGFDMNFNVADIISYYSEQSPAKQGEFVHNCIIASNEAASCPGGILKRAIFSLTRLPEFTADNAEQIDLLRQIR